MLTDLLSPILPKKSDERGLTALTLVIMAPLFIGMIILAFTSSSSTQTDHNISSAAQNAARTAAFCCDNAADAAVVAHNIAFSVVVENSVSCSNFVDPDVVGPDVRVRFFGPLVDNPAGTIQRGHELLATVDNPRSFPPSALRNFLIIDEDNHPLEGQDPLRPGGVIQVAVFCNLPIQDLTGLWVPFVGDTNRIGVFNAVIDPFISVASGGGR